MSTLYYIYEQAMAARSAISGFVTAQSTDRFTPSRDTVQET